MVPNRKCKIEARSVQFDRLKILFLGDARSPHLKRWLSSFSKREHEVHLGTVYPEAIRVRENGISVHDISSKSNFSKFNFLGMLRNTLAILRSIRPDILHAHYMNNYGWLGALTNFHPFIVTVWGGDVLQDQGAFKKFGSKHLTRLTLRKADLVTADSPNLIEACASLGLDRKSIKHITFGIDTDFFINKPDTSPLRERLNIPKEFYVVFSPRRVDRLMNIETIIRTIPKVVQKIPQTIFLIKIYPGQIDEIYLNQIQQLSQELKVAEHIRYCDDAGDVIMRDCYHVADIVVSIPSSDGMPATIFEAMASRTPIIVTDLTAYNGVVIDGESGLRVPPQNEIRLAEAIIDLITNEKKRNHLVENGFRIVKEKGDLEKEMEKVENLYRSLVRRGGRGSIG